MEKSERSEVIDIMKGIAIVLVLIGHSIQFGSGNEYITKELFFDNFLFKFIYSFHMPLFMIISGYLFFYTINKYSFGENIIKRITNLILPIISWSLMYNIINCLILSEDIFSVKFWETCFSYAIGSFWFIWAIFYCSSVVLIVNSFFSDNILIYLLGLLMTFVIPDHYNVYLYKFMYPFFVIGYLANKFNLFRSEKGVGIINSKKSLLFPFSLIFIFLLLIYNKSIYIYISGYCIFNHANPITMLGIDCFRFVIGLVGCVWFITLMSIIYPKIPILIKKFLILVGKNSLGIYIISDYIFCYMLLRICAKISHINYMLVILETIVILLLSLFFTVFIKKNKITNYLFLGGRN